MHNPFHRFSYNKSYLFERNMQLMKNKNNLYPMEFPNTSDEAQTISFLSN